MAANDFKRFPLPSVAGLLQRRYRGVRVAVERREYANGISGFTISFYAESARVLEWAGLATRRGKNDGLLAPDNIAELGIVGAGSISGVNGTTYIYWHCYDGDPYMPGSRTWPPKKTIHEVERIWKRMARSKPQEVANG